MKRSLNLLSCQGEYSYKVDQNANQRDTDADWTIKPVFEPKKYQKLFFSFLSQCLFLQFYDMFIVL